MERSASVSSGVAAFCFFLEVFDTQPVNMYHSGAAESSGDGLMDHEDMAI